MQKKKLKTEEVRVLMENLRFLNNKVFRTDKMLLPDLLAVESVRSHPLGIVLVPANILPTNCVKKT